MSVRHRPSAWLLAALAWVATTAPLALAAPAGPSGRAAPSADVSVRLQALRDRADRQGRARVLVELAPDADLQAVAPRLARRHDPQDVALRQQAVTRLQDRLLARLGPEAGAGARRFAHLPFLGLEVDALTLDRLAGLPEVLAVEEDRLHRPSLAETTAVIHAPQAWSAGHTGAGQVVAVLDTGVDRDNGLLAGKVVSEACYSTTSATFGSTALCQRGSTAPGAASPCAGVAGCDHGTHVAGIATGRGSGFSGVAPDAGLIAIQVFSRFDGEPYCSAGATCVLAFTSDIVAGLERVYDLRTQYAIAAANLSLGGDPYTSREVCDQEQALTRRAIENLRAVGIAAVAASGNAGRADALDAPACVSSAVSVGATSDADGIASFSNSASWLTLLAPGVNVYSSVPGGFGTKSGTSMATPHVAGALAVLGQAVPGTGVDARVAALRDAGVPVPDGRNGLTFPRLLVDAAVRALAGVTSPGETPVDSDGDGVADPSDNCTRVANADQRDTNGDGYGNLCDPDFDGSGRVSFGDLSYLKSVWGSDDPDADLDGSGRVSFGDLSRMKAMWGQAPGPSGLVAP
jgi:subtilisin family serine protease